MNRLITAAALLICASPLLAADLTIEWRNPTTYCDDTPLPVERIKVLELYLDTKPIPGPAADADPCAEPPTEPPAGFEPVQVTGGETSVTVSVESGKTYYVRARISDIDNNWSAFTSQATKTVGFGRLSPPAVLLLQFQ
jgi:hypothetical protein